MIIYETHEDPIQAAMYLVQLSQKEAYATIEMYTHLMSSAIGKLDPEYYNANQNTLYPINDAPEDRHCISWLLSAENFTWLIQKTIKLYDLLPGGSVPNTLLTALADCFIWYNSQSSGKFAFEKRTPFIHHPFNELPTKDNPPRRLSTYQAYRTFLVEKCLDEKCLDEKHLDEKPLS